MEDNTKFFKHFIIASVVIILTSIALAIYDVKYGFGLAMNLLLIIVSIQREKEKHDQGVAKRTWLKYFLTKWDNYLLIWLGAVILITIQSYVVEVLSEYFKWEYSFLYHAAGQYVIAASLGWSSDIIIDKLYKRRKQIIDKLDAGL